MPRWPEWTGLSEKRWSKDPGEELRPAKTAWDWLQLIAVPLALAVLALLFNTWLSGREAGRDEVPAKRDREIAGQARLDQILTDYIRDMSKLVLERHLLRSRYGSDVQAVARMLTLATVRRLDGGRKGEVLAYLMEARLLGVGGTAGSGAPGQGRARVKVDMEGADLRGADLSSHSVSGWLEGVDLRDARFNSAFLDGAQFNGSGLRGASFRKAVFSEADFTAARLNHAVFERVSIIGDTSFAAACLSHVTFANADVREAHWGDARGASVGFVGTRAIVARELRDAVFLDSNLGAAKEIIGPLPQGWRRSGRKKLRLARAMVKNCG